MVQEFEGMLEESRDIKLGFRYGQARTLFEDDSRWKVRSHLCKELCLSELLHSGAYIKQLYGSCGGLYLHSQVKVVSSCLTVLLAVHVPAALHNTTAVNVMSLGTHVPGHLGANTRAQYQLDTAPLRFCFGNWH